MTLSKFPIEPLDLLGLEKTTLNIIKNNTFFKEFSPRIMSEAETEFFRLNSLKESDFKNGTKILDFESYLEAMIKELGEKIYKIYFGGHITLASKDKFDKISYYFALFDIERKQLLRKFHFDFEELDTSTTPNYHIQYAGKLSKYIQDDGVDKIHEDKIFSKIELPRIPYMPITLIQLLTIIFKAFNLENASKVISDDFWIGHLRKCEKKINSKYFEICKKVNDGDDKSLLLDCFYQS